MVCTAMLYGINTSMGCGDGFHAFQNSLQPPLRFYSICLATALSTGPPTQMLPKPQAAHLKHCTWLLHTAVNTNQLMTAGNEFAHLRHISEQVREGCAGERGDAAIATGYRSTQCLHPQDCLGAAALWSSLPGSEGLFYRLQSKSWSSYK